MELKEGMFVRTNEGIITKIIEIDKDGFERFDKLVDFTNYEITKASYNIIDLIEVGDYVNGYRVKQDEEGKLYYHKIIGYDLLEKCNIKSIVTKEMFANAEYKVETN